MGGAADKAAGPGAHGDGHPRRGALQELAARGNGGAGEIHVLQLGEMRTANSVTHDVPPRSVCWELTALLGAWALTTPCRPSHRTAAAKLSARQPKRTARAACAARHRAKPVPPPTEARRCRTARDLLRCTRPNLGQLAKACPRPKFRLPAVSHAGGKPPMPMASVFLGDPSHFLRHPPPCLTLQVCASGIAPARGSRCTSPTR